MSRSGVCACTILVTAVLFAPGYADVRLPAVLSDNMVIQQSPRVPIWGWAEPGEGVLLTASWQDEPTGAVADDNGKWIVYIQSPANGGPYSLTVKGENTVKIDNILCGEVWIGSGQSNMAWQVRNCDNAEQEIAAADYPQIRLFSVVRKVADAPQEDCEGSWQVCSPDTVAGFSAAAYFFGRTLHRELGAPVGLINTSWGGTPAESWTRREILEAHKDLKPIVDRFEERMQAYPAEQEKYEQQLAEWKEKAAQAKADGKPAPRRPRPPFGPGHPHTPSGLYNGMIRPLIPLAIRGAIWYQGEANTGRAYQYRALFPAMIRNWRADWGQDDFPFLFVQIAPFKGYGDGTCPELQEAQFLTLDAVGNTGMVVCTDIGNVDDIHPRNKQDVGIRLALWALSKAYGQALTCSGPLYKRMQVEGDKVRLFFEYAAGGLVARDGPLTHFTIAGEDKQFVDAKAVIDGQTIVVSSDQVPDPVAVRFAWTKIAEPSLFNKAGLPASPFRTDNWPGVTFESR